jgi:replicative DNA helicase
MTAINAMLMPHNTELEQSVLSAAINFREDVSKLKPEHFYNGAHKTLFSAIDALRKKQEPVELPLLFGELKGKGFNPLDFSNHISKILEAPPPADISVASKKLVSFYQLREAIKISSAAIKRALAAGPDDAVEVITYLERAIERIKSGSPTEWQHISTIIESCIDTAERMRHNSGITGVPTGYPDLDWYTCGFQPGDLIVLAARPSMGKTAFAINCALNGALKGFGSGILSLEMANRQLGNRMLAIKSSINALKFRSGRFLPQDWDRMTDAAERLSDLGIWVDDAPRASYSDLAAKIKTLVSAHGVKCIWIDYLGFLTGDKDNGRVQEVESITRALKQTAKDLMVPIVLICQLNRQCETRPGNKRPVLSDLRDSGAIEQDADVVLFLYRDEVYHKETKEPGIAEVSISKQRNGPTGTVKLAWQEEFTRFSSLEVEN